MNAIVNVEILMLIHRTISQYAPNMQYQYTYPYTQGAYYERYRNDEYELERKRKHFGHDINIQLENKHKKLKCKCSKRHCKNKLEKPDEGSRCTCPNDNVQNYYQYDNKDCNGYQIDTSTPNAPYAPKAPYTPNAPNALYNSFYPFKFVTAPPNVLKTLNLEHFLHLFTFTTTAKSVTTSSVKISTESEEKNVLGGVEMDVEDEKDYRTYEDNEQESSSIEKTQETGYVDTQSTGPFLDTKQPLHFEECSKKRLCPQRECDKKIGKYYVNDIIERPTLGNRQKRYLDANDRVHTDNIKP